MDRMGDLRNGMSGMANPPPKATPESFCFLLFLFGHRKGLFLLAQVINTIKAPKSCRCSPHSPQAHAAAHFRDVETPGSTHRNLGTPPIAGGTARVRTLSQRAEPGRALDAQDKARRPHSPPYPDGSRGHLALKDGGT